MSEAEIRRGLAETLRHLADTTDVIDDDQLSTIGFQLRILADDAEFSRPVAGSGRRRAGRRAPL